MFSGTIKNIVEYFKSQKGIVAMVQVGSSITSSKPHDIDILLLVDNKTNAIESINAFSRKYKKSFILCDDAYRFKNLDTIEISLVPKEISKIAKQIKRILSGQTLERRNKVWAVGGFFPEILLKDFEEGKLLWEDNFGTYSKLIGRILEEKGNFFRHLTNRLSEEIELKTKLLEKIIPSGIYRNALICDIQLATIRRIYAQEGRFFVGLKKYKKDLVNLTKDSQEKIKNIESLSIPLNDKIEYETISV